MTAIQDPVARVYAQALLQAADAAGGVPTLTEVGDRCAGAAEAWRTRPTLAMFFLSPTVTDDAKVHALDALLSAGGAPAVWQNFLRLLLRRNRLLSLPEIAGAFRILLDERLSRQPVTLVTAAPVPQDDLNRWVAALRTALGREPVVRHVVKPEILAGAIVVAGDVVADGSVRRQLNQWHRRLIERGSHARES
jgi:F-type H+-transporting ATPase subunit delta